MRNYTITVNDNVYEVAVEKSASTGAAPVAKTITPAPKAAPAAAPKATLARAAGFVMVPAPMPDRILGVKAAVGQAVRKGDVVVALEAMKIENEIAAPSDETVASVNVFAGDSVEAGAMLVILN